MNRPQLAVLNHLLAQQEGVRQRLAEHAGRRFRVELPPLGVSAVVLADGFAGQTDGEPEARVRLSSSLLVKRLTGGEPGAGDVQLDGDAELGLALARILADLRWDAVEDLSRVVGDVAAYRAERWLRGALGVKGEVAWRLASAYAEHLKEETPLLCKRTQVDAWHGQVDALRAKLCLVRETREMPCAKRGEHHPAKRFQRGARRQRQGSTTTPERLCERR